MPGSVCNDSIVPLLQFEAVAWHFVVNFLAKCLAPRTPVRGSVKVLVAKFLSARLGSLFPDCVFLFLLDDGTPALVSLEHQSSRDGRMPFRQARYIVHAKERFRLEIPNFAERGLLAIRLTWYTGARRWPRTRRRADGTAGRRDDEWLFPDFGPVAMPGLGHVSAPPCMVVPMNEAPSSLLADRTLPCRIAQLLETPVSRLSEGGARTPLPAAELAGELRLRIRAFRDMNGYSPEWRSHISEMLEHGLALLKDRERLAEVLSMLEGQLFRRMFEGDSEEVEEVLQQLTDRIASTQGDWEAKGRAEGKAEGLAEGKAEGLAESVEWLIDARFGAKVVKDVRRLLPNGLFTLAGIGRLILDSESSGELLAKVRKLSGGKD